MKQHNILRVVGVLGVLAAYLFYVLYNGNISVLYAIITVIIALVAPEVIDRLPWGPTK